MIVYIVENASSAKWSAPFADRVFVFIDPEAAISKAKELGFNDTLFGLAPEQLNPGAKRMYDEGPDRRISILTLEVQQDLGK